MNETTETTETDDAYRRRLRLRREVYELEAKRWTVAEAAIFGAVIGAAIWTAGAVFVWWLLT